MTMMKEGQDEDQHDPSYGVGRMSECGYALVTRCEYLPSAAVSFGPSMLTTCTRRVLFGLMKPVEQL